jgi:hypothetical protein
MAKKCIKMLNITNHQRKANQNKNEISLHPTKNDYNRKTEDKNCWRECAEKGTLAHH